MTRFIAILLLMIVGCRPQSPQADSSELRIISLSPALTGILEDVGLGDSIVGRSNYCEFTLRDAGEIPPVGDLHERNWEAIIRLQPTHIFIQADSTEQDLALAGMSDEYGWEFHAWPLRDMNDIKHVLKELPSIPPVSREESWDSIRAKCHELSMAMDDAMAVSEVGQDDRVLIVNDGLPPLASGRNTYLVEMLETTGAINVIESEGWSSLSIEDVIRLRPDIVIVLGERAVDLQPALAPSVKEALPETAFHWLVHPRINIPGPHLAVVCQMLRDILSKH